VRPHARPHTPRRALRLSLSMLLGLAALSASPAAARQQEDVADLVQRLHRSGDEGAFRRDARLLGTDAVRPLLQAFLDGEPLAPGMPTGHDALLIETLGRFETEDVFEVLEPMLRPGGQEPARLLLLLAEFGPVGDLEGLYRFAESSAPTTGDRREFERALRRGTARVLTRSRSSFTTASRLVDELDSELSPLLLGGIADTGNPLGFQLLSNLAVEESDLGNQALARLAGALDAGRAPFDDDLASDLRRLLRSDDPHRLTSTLRALGSLEDRESLASVIDFLEHPNAQVSRAAAAALPRIAGTTLPPDPVRWQAWFERELDWWDLEAPALRDALWNGGREEILTAVGQVVLHPLFRHELTGDLTPLLAEPDEGVRRLVAGALAQLESSLAVEDLLAAGAAASGDEAQLYQSVLRRILHQPKATDPPHWSLVWSTSASASEVR